MHTFQLICIACCYLPALIIEILRRRSNSDFPDDSSQQTASETHSVSASFLTTVFLTLIGLIIQTLYLIGKIDLSANITPLSSLQGIMISASWLMSLIFLASLRRAYGTIFPILTMTASLCLILAAFWASDVQFSRQPVMRWWGLIHGLSQLTFFVSLTVGLIVGILYLWQDRRLKLRLSYGTWMLPPLERLARINRASLIWSLASLAPGIVSGFVLLNARPETISLADYALSPTIIGSLIIFLWILWTIIRSMVFGAFTEAKATARRTIFLFIVLTITLVAAYFSSLGHLSMQPSKDTETEATDSNAPQSELNPARLPNEAKEAQE
ncbi:MAG: hypothetical protein IJQ39_01545 [Thermoguttaceae bacterium]|nr:hypothetical protein [Thermoguttaceae bacterium]